MKIDIGQIFEGGCNKPEQVYNENTLDTENGIDEWTERNRPVLEANGPSFDKEAFISSIKENPNPTTVLTIDSLG